MLTVVVIKMFGDIKTFGFGINDVFRVLDPHSFHTLSSADLVPLVAKTIGTPLFAWVYVATSISGFMTATGAAGGWFRSLLFLVSTIILRASSAIPIVVQLLSAFAFVFGLWGFIEMYLREGNAWT